VVVAGGKAPKPQFTADFGIHCNDTLLATGGNQYYSLEPGSTLLLEGEDDGQPMLVEITVLPKIRWITFQAKGGDMKVKTRVVREREWTNGELSQVSRNYCAFCPKTGNIYYFGEKVNHYENGQIVSHEDSWIAGEDGAQPGLLVPGHFLLGSRYHQELAPDISMDRASRCTRQAWVSSWMGSYSSSTITIEPQPTQRSPASRHRCAPGNRSVMPSSRSCCSLADRATHSPICMRALSPSSRRFLER
jgi:hypothetical protein